MPATKPWFVLAGGGTGGHLYPGIAVAERFRAIQPDVEVTIFGTTRPIDEKLSASAGFELVRQEVRPLPTKPWRWPGFLRAWRRSIDQARRRFEERPPTVVLGLGGYAAGPPVEAAVKLGAPTAVFNPDAIPGKANTRLGKKVDRVFVQWEETAERFPKAREVRVTGCPVRAEFGAATRENGCRALKLDPARPVLLVTGASQGARSINAAMMEMFDLWKVARDWQIVHLTGPADLETCRAKYKENGIEARALAYTDHMALCMAAADIVISRAGASTLAEITAVGVASVLLPYPFDRNRHQHANARVLAEAFAAEIVEDHNDPRDNAHRLRDTLRDLMKSPQRRRRMAQAAAAMGHTDAAETIAEELFEMARRGV